MVAQAAKGRGDERHLFAASTVAPVRCADRHRTARLTTAVDWPSEGIACAALSLTCTPYRVIEKRAATRQWDRQTNNLI